MTAGIEYSQSYVVEGNEAKITARYVCEQEDALVPPDTRFGFEFFATGAPIELGIMALPVAPRPRSTARTALAGPAPAVPEATRVLGGLGTGVPRVSARMRRPQITLPGGIDGGLLNDWDRPPDPPGGGGNTLQAALRVELYAPRATTPTASWNLPEERANTIRRVPWPGQGLPMPGIFDMPGWWRCEVRGTGPDPMRLRLEAAAPIGRVPVRVQTMTTRLLDNTFRMALEALTPKIEIRSSRLTISIGADLQKLYGVDAIYVDKSIAPVTVTAKLRSLAVEATSAQDLFDRFRAVERLAEGNTNPIYDVIAAAAKKEREQYQQRCQADDIAVRIRVAFQRGNVQAYGLDLAEIGETGVIYFIFDRALTKVTHYVSLPIKLVGAADVLEDFGILPSPTEEIEKLVREMLVKRVSDDSHLTYGGMLVTYLREVLGRAVGKRGVAQTARKTPEGWRVTYFSDLPPPDPSRPVPRGHVVVGGPTTTRASTGPAPAADPAPPPTDPPPPPPASTRGTWPPEFLIEGGPALARLDRVRSLIFIMLENRSFDHLLGDLPRVRPRPGRQVDGLPADASSAPVGGLLDPVRAVPATSIGLDTAIWTSPHHHHEHVMFQMGGGTHETSGSGAMKGFARDLADRTDSPQIAMTYFQEAQLPTYYRLADEFMICDRWFCAHPGATWPNRWATLLGGKVPALDNFEAEDPRIGFLEGRTIFQTLDENGVDWRLFESDISLIRMFDRYRLDDRKVVPFDDPNDGLAAVLRGGAALPRVMFIEPNFVDTPPLKEASDDHPPADLARGQEFIGNICNLLWQSGRWQDVALVVTYDEHGGFYDHVPPPGTPMGPPELAGKYPRLHPDSADCLGPRVPAFVVSPYVGAGSVCHTVLDHLAILKTILVHNRASFYPQTFTSFGTRVNESPHLGQALELDTPRPTPGTFPTRRGRLRDPVVTTVTATPVTPMTPVRSVTPVLPTRAPRPTPPAVAPTTVLSTTATATTAAPAAPAGGQSPSSRSVPVGWDEVEPARDDFHAALRNALKPKR